jgi:hypothetical protein
MTDITSLKATPERLRGLNALLEVALALPAPQLDAWLASLPEEQQAHVPVLRAMPSPIRPATRWGPTACCANWALAAWPPCGWPSAATAC